VRTAQGQKMASPLWQTAAWPMTCRVSAASVSRATRMRHPLERQTEAKSAEGAKQRRLPRGIRSVRPAHKGESGNEDPVLHASGRRAQLPVRCRARQVRYADHERGPQQGDVILRTQSSASSLPIDSYTRTATAEKWVPM
jgi:hypothetical protein